MLKLRLRPVTWGTLYVSLIPVFAIVYAFFPVAGPQGEASALGWTGLYFSTVVVTTLGFGDISPSGTLGMFLVGLQASLGVLFMGMFLVAIGSSTAEKIRKENDLRDLRMKAHEDHERFRVLERRFRAELNFFEKSAGSCLNGKPAISYSEHNHWSRVLWIWKPYELAHVRSGFSVVPGTTAISDLKLSLPPLLDTAEEIAALGRYTGLDPELNSILMFIKSNFLTKQDLEIIEGMPKYDDELTKILNVAYLSSEEASQEIFEKFNYHPVWKATEALRRNLSILRKHLLRFQERSGELAMLNEEEWLCSYSSRTV